MQEVEFLCQFNPHRQVIKVDGDGQSEIILTSDATQLAKVLTALANFKECSLICRLRKDGKGNNQKEKQRRKAIKDKLNQFRTG
jgi:hypothetical protein